MLRYNFRFTIGRKKGYKFEYDLRPRALIESQGYQIFMRPKRLRQQMPVDNLFIAYLPMIYNKLLELSTPNKKADYITHKALTKENKSLHTDDSLYQSDSLKESQIAETAVITLINQFKLYLNYVEQHTLEKPNSKESNLESAYGIQYEHVKELIKSIENAFEQITNKNLTCDENYQIEKPTTKEAAINTTDAAEVLNVAELKIIESFQIITKLFYDAVIENQNAFKKSDIEAEIEKTNAFSKENKSILTESHYKLTKAFISVFYHFTSNIFNASKKDVLKANESFVFYEKYLLKNDFAEFDSELKFDAHTEAEQAADKIQIADLLKDMNQESLFDSSMTANIMIDAVKRMSQSIRQIESLSENEKYMEAIPKAYGKIEQYKLLKIIVDAFVESIEFAERNSKGLTIEKDYTPDKIVELFKSIDMTADKEKIQITEIEKATLIMVLAEAYKQGESELRKVVELFADSTKSAQTQSLIIKLAKDDNLLSLYRQFWFLRHSGDNDWILLPYDYNGGIGHPIPDGADLGLEKIPVSIVIMVDFINILLLMLSRFMRQLAGYTGVQAIKSIVHIIWQWLTLDTSREAESISDYDRCFRWLRWEAEKIINLASEDCELTGLYWVERLIQELIIYMQQHHLDVMPIFEGLAKMDELRNVFNDPQNDIPYVINKVKAIKNIILGG